MEEEKAFLIQIMKHGNYVMNIGVRNGSGDYETDQGIISDKNDPGNFEYRYMSFPEMRSLLRANIVTIKALEIR